MFNPEGSEGDALQVPLSPEFVGVMDEMATSLLKVNGEPEYAMDGATMVTQRLNSPVLETPVDEVAVTLYVVLVPLIVGVPLMVHVPWFSANPFGSEGVMLHVAPETSALETAPVL